MIKKDGFEFGFDEIKCASCDGNCCIGESGYIWITPLEIESLALFLKLSVSEVKKKYLDKIRYKYSIKEIKTKKDNYSCVFFDLEFRRCSIYDLRPSQCRSFPFWEHFKKNKEEVIKECPAIIL